jgi:hypothetical protein
MKRLLAIGWAAMMATVARGQATTPAASAPDRSSPRAALVSLYSALRAGDVPAATSTLLFTDAREQERATINLTTQWAPLALMHAMEKRFGEAARRAFSNASLVKTADEALEKIRVADITINGDTATVGEKKAAVDPNAETEVTGVKLKKVGDQWKIVAATFQDVASEVPANQLAMLKALGEATAAATSAVKKQVDAGEFSSADDAYKAYRVMLQSAARNSPPPAAGRAP